MANEKIGVEAELLLNKWSPNVQRLISDASRMDKSFDQIVQGSGKVDRAMTMMSGAMSAAVSGVTIGGFVQLVGSLNETGIQARATERAFVQLAGGQEQAERMMVKLRAATGGVVDDMTLQAGATRMLLTGLARTSDEAARLTEIAVKLGGAMGNDAASSLENFNAALMNQSYERLDSVGISASRVRARVNELKEAGESMEDAFRLAVLEQGAVAMERLGDAANSSETALNRLNTRIENAKTGLAEFVATGVDAGAMIIELGVRWAEFQSGTFQDRMRAEDMLAFQGDVLARAYGIDKIAGQEGSFSDAVYFFNTLTVAVDEYEKATGRAVETTDDITAALQQHGSSIGAQGFTQQEIDAARFFYENQMNAEDWLQTQRALVESVTGVQNKFNDALLYTAGLYDRLEAGQGRYIQQQQRAQYPGLGDAQTLQNQINTELMGNLIGDPYRGMRNVFADSDYMPQFITRDQADRVRDIADSYDELVERMKDGEKAEIVSEDEVRMITEMAQEAGKVADAADKAASRFENLKLSDVFGTTGGGLLGEASDSLMRRLGDRGYSEEQLGALQDALNLASGRETMASQAFESDVLPIIEQVYLQYGEDAAVTALNNWRRGVEFATLNNVPLDLLADNMGALTGYTLGGTSTGTPITFTIEPYIDATTWQDSLQTQIGDTPQAMADALKEQFPGIEFDPNLFVTLDNLQVDPASIREEDIRPKIEDTIRAAMLAQYNQSGLQLISEEEVTNSASFKDAVDRAVANVFENITRPPSQTNPNAVSTLSAAQADIQARYGYLASLAELQTAVGTSDPNMVQPGTYSLGGGLQQMQNFNPETFVQGLTNIQQPVADAVTTINTSLQTLGRAPGGAQTAYAPGAGATTGTVFDTLASGIRTFGDQVAMTAPLAAGQITAVQTSYQGTSLAAEKLATGQPVLQKYFGSIKSGAQQAYDVVILLASALQSIDSTVRGTAGVVGGVSGARAEGGRVMSNGRYLVGEGGAEIFAPGRAGYVLNNAKTESILAGLSAMMAGGYQDNSTRSQSVNINVVNNSPAQSSLTDQRVADAMRGF